MISCKNGKTGDLTKKWESPGKTGGWGYMGVLRFQLSNFKNFQEKYF